MQGGFIISNLAIISIAFTVLFVVQSVSGSLTDSFESTGISDAYATADARLTIQSVAADDGNRSNTDLVGKGGIDLVTNRKKVLTKSSSLGAVVNEDVVSPANAEHVLVIQADKPTVGASGSQDPTVEQNSSIGNSYSQNCYNQTDCSSQRIGLTYNDSTPCWPQAAQPPKGAPNVIFIVLDDVGFGQLGCFGGPIETPNIDRLASSGLRYTNFHTTALCSPTRACLLTGRNHHSVGMATVAEVSSGYPGYNMNLSKNAATIAEMLKEQGYNTFAVGKWHLAPQETINAAGPYDEWPTGRGFDRFYGYMLGQTNQWYPDLVSDTKRIDPPATPEQGYHLSQDLVNQSEKFITDQQAVSPGKPYFLYLAFGACHAPHHVPKEYIDKYSGRFDQGWDAVRNETLARQKSMGIVPADTVLPPRNPGIKAWDNLSTDEKRVYARMQEVFAGFLDHTDHQIGRIIDYLNRTGQMNNTIIVLLSDNGASPEGDLNGSFNNYVEANGLPNERVDYLLSQIDELGGPNAYNHYPQGWAMAGNTPFKRYKQNTFEGGVHDPLIVYYPPEIKDEGGLRNQFTHAIDIVPTILDVVGICAPKVYNGIPQKPIEGSSIVYTFNDSNASDRKDVQYFEMLGSRGLWYNGWKAVTYHPLNSGDFENDTWELYNLLKDASESNNLADAYPLKTAEMVDRWFAQAGKYNVLPLDDRTYERAIKPPKLGTFAYYPGQAKILEPDIPDTLNSSYNITAYVDIQRNNTEGVLFSIGGRFGGLSLYIQNNRLTYEYNFLDKVRYVITSKTEIPTGNSTLGFTFNKTGNHRGMGTLLINGTEVGRGPILLTEIARYSEEEGLEIGKDPQTPVAESYKSPFIFNGTLKKVVMEVTGTIEPRPIINRALERWSLVTA